MTRVKSPVSNCQEKAKEHIPAMVFKWQYHRPFWRLKGTGSYCFNNLLQTEWGKQPLTFSSMQTNTDAFVNSADPDETPYNESSHQDLHCFQSCYWFVTEIPICNNGCVQIQRWKSPFQKLRGERVNLTNSSHHSSRQHSVFLSFSQENKAWHFMYMHCLQMMQNTQKGPLCNLRIT